MLALAVSSHCACNLLNTTLRRRCAVRLTQKSPHDASAIDAPVVSLDVSGAEAPVESSVDSMVVSDVSGAAADAVVAATLVVAALDDAVELADFVSLAHALSTTRAATPRVAAISPADGRCKCRP